MTKKSEAQNEIQKENQNEIKQSKPFVMLSETKHLLVHQCNNSCHSECNEESCLCFGVTFQEILRYAQDDKEWKAQDDKEK
jgi:hypothetical protein